MKKQINFKKIGGLFLGAFVISFFITRTTSASLLQLPKDTAKDKRFVAKALESGMMEIQSGSLAVDYAVSNEVKEFGRMMVEEHRKANLDLKELAQQNGYSVNDVDTTSIAMQVKKMAELQSDDFDRKFMKQMVKDHEKVIMLFEKEVKQGSDEEILTWAESTLPTLRKHLLQAQNIYNNLVSAER